MFSTMLLDVKNKTQMQSVNLWLARNTGQWSAQCNAQGQAYTPELMQQLAAEREEAQRLAVLREEAHRLAEAQRLAERFAEREAERQAEAQRLAEREAERQRRNVESMAMVEAKMEEERRLAAIYHAGREEGLRVSGEKIAEYRRQLGGRVEWGCGVRR